ncbi:MAG: hypothetical protein QXS13_01685 [Acidilobaceae archaeon]
MSLQRLIREIRNKIIYVLSAVVLVVIAIVITMSILFPTFYTINDVCK